MRTTLTIVALLIAVILAGVSGCGPTAYKITPIPVTEELVEATVKKDPGIFLPKVALIDLDGILMNARRTTLLGEDENPTALAVEKLQKAAADPFVKAVILRINSPGGTVTASDVLYQEVKKVRAGSARRPGKPVIAMIMDVGASGGYYIACAADEIIAYPTGVTGSIGVMMMTLNVKGLFDKIGVETDAIKSGPRKDAGSPFRPMKPEELKIFQDLINEYYDGFLHVVAGSRANLTPERIRELADGRIYSGTQAEKLGLIDRTGTLDTAIDRAKEVARAPAVNVVMYHRPAGYRGSMYSKAPGDGRSASQINLLNVDLPDVFFTQGYFMYLWQP